MADVGKAVGAVFVCEKAKASRTRFDDVIEILKRCADDDGSPRGCDLLQIAEDKIRSLGDARHIYIRSLEELVEWETEEHRKGKRAS